MTSSRQNVDNIEERIQEFAHTGENWQLAAQTLAAQTLAAQTLANPSSTNPNNQPLAAITLAAKP